MTPVERLQAAIEKLERLKAESTPGPWSVNVHHNAMHSAEFRAPGPWNGFMLVAAHVNDADPDLIVTLHRTINAHLAILQFGVQRQKAVDWLNRPGSDKHVEAARLELALADAILGGGS